MANVTPLQPSPGLASPTLLVDLALEPLDLAPQVGDDAGILGDVVGDTEQVLLHLEGARDAGRAGTVTPSTGACLWGLPFLFVPLSLLPAPGFLDASNNLLASNSTTWDRAMLLKCCFPCSTFTCC